MGGGLFRRGCGLPAIASCVYCGEPFCEEHGRRGADYTDVCARPKCRARQRDLEAHLAWKSHQQRFNNVSICAFETCDLRIRHQCARCRLMFCNDHVTERELVDATVRPRRRVRIVICEHCYDRRKLWE